MNTYHSIVSHYEDCFARHGDTTQGVDWPNLPDLQKRFDVMLDVVRQPQRSATLLDFGCGTGMLYDHILESSRSEHIIYSGLDLSETFVGHCRQKFPDTPFYLVDLLQQPNQLGKYDYIVMNGVFTEKGELSFDEMLEYLQKLLVTVFSKVRVGVAFNVMSKHVDWERQDLFHLPMDTVAAFLVKNLTRNFVIRNDYGLYEYTTYIYK